MLQFIIKNKNTFSEFLINVHVVVYTIGYIRFYFDDQDSTDRILFVIWLIAKLETHDSERYDKTFQVNVAIDGLTEDH